MKYTNKQNLPLSLAVWLAYDDYELPNIDKLISATGLLKPIKSIILGFRTKSGTLDVSELIPSSLGKAIHSAIENAWNSNKLDSILNDLGLPNAIKNNYSFNSSKSSKIPIYMEQRSSKELEGWVVTGKFDFVSNGKLEDFKSTGVNSWISQIHKDKYIQQCSIYRWLNPDIILDDTCIINYIFTDWSLTKARQDKTYPKARIISQEYEMMDIKETERFIKNKLKLLNKYLSEEESNIPECTEEELWAKKAIYSYYKNPNKLDRSTKNFDSYYEAHSKFIEDGSVGIVKERKGEVVFCRYCSAKNICEQANRYIQEGRLIV